MQRKATLALALAVLAMLVGLSHAPHALPGDMFQVGRTAHAQAVTPGAEAQPSRKPAKSQDPGGGQEWLAVLPALADLGPEFVSRTIAADGVVTRTGRCAGTPGCRGPPTS